MTNTRITLIAAATIPLLALTGCAGSSKAAPETTPTTPATSATPTSTPGSATPTAQSSAELSAQAEEVYRRQHAAFNALAKQGGLAMSEPTPPALSADLAGQALTKRLNELHQEKLKGFKHVSGDGKIVWVKPSDRQKAGAVVALDSCEDGTQFVSVVDGRKIHGVMVRVTTYFAPVEGKLKAIDSENQTVKSCAG